MARVISRRKLAEYVADQLLAGDKDIVAQLAAHLVQTRKVRTLELVVRDIETALMERGTLVADIHSAHDLTDTLKRDITAFLKKETGARTVHLREAIDTTLIGGVQIETPAATLDTTIKHKLQQLKAAKQ
ncbi:MAG: F0F1 ATP synthase subunit delta [Candidatus Saccharimonadales bacterium]